MRGRMRTVAIVGVLALAALLAACGGSGGSGGAADRAGGGDGADRDGEGAAASAFEPRVVARGGVEITIVPLEVSETGAVFEVRLDTHSGSLDANLAGAAELSVGGRSWGTPEWDGASPGGHHRAGELRFEAKGPARGAVTLSLGGFGDPVVAEWEAGGASA